MGAILIGEVFVGLLRGYLSHRFILCSVAYLVIGLSDRMFKSLFSTRVFDSKDAEQLRLLG